MKLKYSISIIASLALSISLMSCGAKKDDKDNKKNVNINKYVTYSFSGVDTKGVCNIKIDYNQMVEDNRRAFGLKKDYTEEEKNEVVSEIESIINGNINTSDYLSNGDNIKFIWCDKNFDDVEDSFSINLKYSDIDLLVKGLNDFIELDPFESLEVSFTGTAPNGKINMKVVNKAISIDEAYTSSYSFHYNADKNSGLSNGDIVTISIEDADELLAQSGFVVSQRSKEYKVEGLDFYAEKFADIPKNDVEIMDQHNIDLLNAHIASNWVETESLKNVELINYYLLSAKDGISVSTKNYLYYIYKIDVENSEGSCSYYYYTYYPNILITSDGKCSYDLNKAVRPDGGVYLNSSTYGEAFLMGKYYYLGFEKLEELYNKHVTAQVDKYKCEEIKLNSN